MQSPESAFANQEQQPANEVMFYQWARQLLETVSASAEVKSELLNRLCTSFREVLQEIQRLQKSGRSVDIDALVEGLFSTSIYQVGASDNPVYFHLNDAIRIFKIWLNQIHTLQKKALLTMLAE